MPFLPPPPHPAATSTDATSASAATSRALFSLSIGCLSSVASGRRYSRASSPAPADGGPPVRPSPPPPQEQTPYLDALVGYVERSPARLHVPGHKGGPGADT